ncbi:hypothetical protein EYZ11_007517 [Aspergillus tanneri]|uniref:Zn(2)-C6 fungal-type domain-containing protein n=1 Tax=Aspergillus tanneri TaxID=1220188 RepID=A0A4S3JF41_9EURO|nr:uncharacterized protein ATNIH1004_006583 [Aspergillus tanneri]KAA8647881.1 hypothetical protein ATNIH1004_006583 [Aspergillus tanneri]THC93008.1 hypothetical protein EYZ11_007517 [Aspergillus tanneri]
MAAVSGQISPTDGMEGQSIRKRPRPVVSCLRCRKKKLRCDRVVPCENCSKSGCATDCAFYQSPESLEGNGIPEPKRMRMSSEAGNPHSADSRNEPVKASGTGILEDLQQRLVKIEELLFIRPKVHLNRRIEASLNDANPASGHVASPIDGPSYLGTLVVKGTRTRYHGQNNRITLLKQFAEAKVFIDQCTKDPSIAGLAKEVQFLQSKSKLSLNSPESISDLDCSPELLQMQACLPHKAVCDRLVDLYTSNFEKTFRILHIPTFLRQYANFWANHESNKDRLSAFLPQLTAVLTVALPLEDPDFRQDQVAVWEYLQTPAVNLVRTWMQKLGRKQRTELCTLQVEALVLLARQVRLVSPEELWRATGMLVRSAMVMGLHLDLSQCLDLSAFEVEKRRRLWITIVEMDLQASILSGMPVTIPNLDFTPLTPANLNDVDISESITELPPAKPLHEWTDALAQVILATSLPHRIRAMSLVQTTRPDLSETLQHGRRVEECLRRIPSSLRLDHRPPKGDSPALLLNRVLLDICIRRPLLCLYRPIIMGERCEDPLFLEVQQACLESSLVVLSYQDYFDPSVADLDFFKSTAYWEVFKRLCRNDISWAALSVCGYMKLSSQQQSTVQTPASSMQEASPASRTPTHTKASLTRLVENTLDGLTRTIGETGGNLKDVLLLAVVLQSVRARGSAELKEQWMQQGAMKALSACRQHLLPSVSQQSYAYTLEEFAQMFRATRMFPSTTDAGCTPTSQPHLSEFLAESSALATEFSNFQGDPFAFEDGSFAWNFNPSV